MAEPELIGPPDAGTVKSAALCLTHNCNLRCKYCYAGEKANRRMSFETGKQALDFLCEHSPGKCVVTFFGGEPMLEFELLQELVRYSFDRHGRKIEFRMTTNGTLITKETLTYLQGHGIYFALSLDGSREQHDLVRRYADHRGSYHAVAGNLKEILAHNPYTVAISVIVPETVPYLAAGVKDLFGQGFRYVMQTLDYSAAWESVHIQKLRDQYCELTEFYMQRLVAGEKIYYSPFDERIKTRAQQPYHPGDLCDLANSVVAVAASGRIYPCVQFVGADDENGQQNCIGDIRQGFDEERRRFFVEQNYLDKESCDGCALYGRCATFCGCVNWKATGYLNRIPPIICEHERMLIPIVDKMANQLWKRDVKLFKRKFYEKTFAVSSYLEDCLIRGRKSDVKH